MEFLKISNAEYRAMEGISSSELKKIAKSPAHYKFYKENPEETDTPSLLFGRAAHKYMLEEEDFESEFVVAPKVDRRTSDGKKAWAEFMASSEGKDVITEEDFQIIKDMKKAFIETPYVKKLIEGQHEVSMFGIDDETGLKIKARPDVINLEKKIIVDYKTCTDAATEKFMRKSIELNYDLQAAFYCDIAKQNTGDDFIFVFIAQEKDKKSGYQCNILQADEAYIRSGRDMYKSMLQTYKECEDTGHWWGYLGKENEINSLMLPKWLADMYGEEIDD